MVVKTLNTSINSPSSRETTTPGGYAEIHENLRVNTLDISDYMVNTILGRETPVEATAVETTDQALETEDDSTQQDRLGKLGAYAWLGQQGLAERRARKAQRLQNRLEKLADNVNDSRFSKLKKKLGRGALITAAIAGTAAGAVLLLQNSRYAVDIGLSMAVDHIDSSPVTNDYTKVVVAGGAGQGDPTGIMAEMKDKGYREGYNVEGVDYPAQVGPVVGVASMDTSTDIGVTDMYGKAHADLVAGRPVELIGYSEGSAVTLETANRLIAENGGVKPDNLSITIIGSPFAQGGILGSNNPFANAAGPVLDMIGIPKGMSVPPGTNIVYFDTDFWANSGNQAPTSMLRQLIEIGFGGHEVPNVDDPNLPRYSFTDSDGVIHTVFSRNDPILQAMMNNGLQVADTAAANRAINALLPLDGSNPNVQLAMSELATTLEHQGDPVSLQVADFIRHLPPEFAQLGQSSMDAFNQISTGGAKIASGDIVGGMQQIMGGLDSFMTALHIAVPQEGQAPQNQIQQLFSGNISQFLHQTTGYDLSSQINGYMGQYSFNASAPASTTNYLNDFLGAVNNSAPTSPAASAAAQFNAQPPLASVSSPVSANTNILPPLSTPNQIVQPLQDAINNTFRPTHNNPIATPPVVEYTPPAPEYTPPVQTYEPTPVVAAPAPDYTPPTPAAVPAVEAPAPAPAPEYHAPAAPVLPSLPNLIDNIFHPNRVEHAPASTPAPVPDLAPAPVSAPEEVAPLTPPADVYEAPAASAPVKQRQGVNLLDIFGSH